jgi:hypothetical protein
VSVGSEWLEWADEDADDFAPLEEEPVEDEQEGDESCR